MMVESVNQSGGCSSQLHSHHHSVSSAVSRYSLNSIIVIVLSHHRRRRSSSNRLGVSRREERYKIQGRPSNPGYRHENVANILLGAVVGGRGGVIILSLSCLFLARASPELQFIYELFQYSLNMFSVRWRTS